ncbi:MAG: NUDIX domain-containing protein [Bacteroidales bacterium]|nr:NUDIX domain-containing protein [Bacteroidales bacterium]MDT8431071.1 NUDIX domain-containing protein [Bacteroidales bacterium]
MYKVFFKDRTVYFGDDFSKAFGRNTGLFYKFNNLQELTELVYVFNELTKIDKLFIFHDDILTLFEEFKACFNYIEAAGGVVIRTDGRFLVMKRDGIWDLPKGKLDPDESTEEAALREVQEETGLEGLEIVQPILSTFHTYQMTRDMNLKKTKWFEMKYTGDATPVPQAEENITEIVWVEPGKTDFIRKNTYPSVLDVLYIRDLL